MIMPPIPVHSSWVPPVLDRIADKKILKLALSILELIVHYICGYMYYPYASLYFQKRGRIHYLDGLRVIDFTEKGTVGIARLRMAKGVESWITVAEARVFFREASSLFSKPDPKLDSGTIWVEDHRETQARLSIEPPLSHSTSGFGRIRWVVDPFKAEPTLTGEQVYIAVKE